MNFLPNTEAARKEMMRAIGINSVDELFADIPAAMRLKSELKLGPAMSEMEVFNLLSEMSKQNDVSNKFLGAGAYNHYIPAAIGHITGRSEFYTAYTPYQAEMSQGSLEMFYEFQSYMAELTGMDVANSSMYDGSTALAEAMLSSKSATGRKEIVVSKSIHPDYRQVVKTYADAGDMIVKEVEFGENGTTNLFNLASVVNENTAGVMLQNPNFFGCIENLAEAEKIIHEKGAMFITCVVEPTSLALIKPPGAFNADFVVGEAASMGNPVNYGGPYVGFFAAKEEHIRKMPGRLTGATKDAEGRRGYVLTLQAREQHIRREKATSNICTAEALVALATTAYLALVGKTGLKKVAEISHKNALYMCDQLEKKGMKRKFNAPFYNEFVIGGKKLNLGLELSRFYPQLKDNYLLCTTEVHSKADIDKGVGSL